MIFNNHSYLEGQHAYLSASKYHWINYDPIKLEESYKRHLATMKGTRLHEYAKESILLGIKQAKVKKTLNMYINDAIGFRMTPEQILFYSENCFGTADAISFRQDVLRIHDLKTGVTPASMKQLEIYAALFLLEYKQKPKDIELRIYQDDLIIVHNPLLEEIEIVCERIIESDKIIQMIKGGL